MNDVTVIDNFLTKEYFDEIQSTIDSSYQPWCYQHNITSVKKKGVGLGYHGFNFWVVNPNKPNNRWGLSVTSIDGGLHGKQLTSLGDYE